MSENWLDKRRSCIFAIIDNERGGRYIAVRRDDQIGRGPYAFENKARKIESGTRARSKESAISGVA